MKCSNIVNLNHFPFRIQNYQIKPLINSRFISKYVKSEKNTFSKVKNLQECPSNLKQRKL